MSDVRLIDANALPNYKCQVTATVGDYKGPAEMRFVFWQDIEKAPTIDAVEVVRCRECKHFVKYDDDYRDEYGCDGYCEEVEYIMDGYYHGAENRNADDFCSRGEKMDGGAEG